MNDNNQHDGEIVGLHNLANGWSCDQYEYCEIHVQPGDLIWLKREVMDPSRWLKVVMLLLCK
jgi:hypothetical protein